MCTLFILVVAWSTVSPPASSVSTEAKLTSIMDYLDEVEKHNVDVVAATEGDASEDVLNTMEKNTNEVILIIFILDLLRECAMHTRKNPYRHTHAIINKYNSIVVVKW